ncbi:MAG TPA: PIG-L family deacetylase, partial [Pseudonocardiaceae bacterium]|nr:PIG-L family deacetylase [Pseudonocardiaceae bacterium]
MSGRLLVVSPHLDDAVMSVGATVAEAVEFGCHVEICTVFAGQPQPPLSGVATRFHAECGLGDDAITRRRSEDIAAVGMLGGHPVHQDLLDAVYRTSHGGWLCTHDRAMFDPLPLDRQLVAAVAEVVAGRITETGPDQVWTCRAVGG